MNEVAPMTSDVRGVAGEAFHKEEGHPARAPRSARFVCERHGERDYHLQRLLGLGDVVSVAVATAAFAVLAGEGGPHSVVEVLCGLAMVPAWIALMGVYGLYERDAKSMRHSTLDDLPSLFHALLLGCLLMWGWMVAVAPVSPTPPSLLIFACLAGTLLLAGRTMARAGFARLGAPERLLVIATGGCSTRLSEKLRATAGPRCELVGIADCSGRTNETSELSQIGDVDSFDLPRLLSAQRVGRVVVVDRGLEPRQLIALLRDCRTAGVKVSLLPSTSGALGPSTQLDALQGATMLAINPPVRSRSSQMAKRSLDLVGAGVLIALTLPLVLVATIAIKLDSSGPVLFLQERVGRHGRRFRLIKLRTMARDAEAARAGLLSQSKDPCWLHLEHDPRVTRLGRVLRRTSLDELPQLWNVLRGEMSLVGPRPLVAEEDVMVSGWARVRLEVTPGLTGLWQVLGRTGIPFEEMVELDYLYVTNWSLWGDVCLILRTLPAVLKRVGAN